ncbi:MAG: hypothetical protein JWO19_1553 [Bryobacterales bacterium]|jgi:hypothetical protein|nr:hypothetical protein [Bryobacterales bacterium]
MNGDRGNEIIEDSAPWKRQVFSPGVDALIAEIRQLGGEAELERLFAQFRKEFEPALQQIRDRLMIVAMDRGMEI